MTYKIKQGEPLVDRILRRVIKRRAFKRCWEWQGAKRNGYGVVNDHGKVLYTHRIMYAHANGVIPHGLVVMHMCDNPACVNPDHLTVGSVADNNADMASKGRAHNAGLSGQAHPRAILSDVIVAALRADYAKDSSRGRVTALAKQYGISKSHAAALLRGDIR